jgi:hypothetical protein
MFDLTYFRVESRPWVCSTASPNCQYLRIARGGAWLPTVTVQNGSEREVCESGIAERKTWRGSSRGSLGALSVAGVLTQACSC